MSKAAGSRWSVGVVVLGGGVSICPGIKWNKAQIVVNGDGDFSGLEQSEDGE